MNKELEQFQQEVERLSGDLAALEQFLKPLLPRHPADNHRRQAQRNAQHPEPTEGQPRA